MNSRIKILREELGLTQEAFAQRLGVGRGVVMNIEYNKTTPKDAFVDLICREFRVRDEWLRHGSGEMFEPTSRDEEIADFVGEVMRSESESFKRRLITLLAELSPEEWELLESFAEKLAKKED